MSLRSSLLPATLVLVAFTAQAQHPLHGPGHPPPGRHPPPHHQGHPPPHPPGHPPPPPPQVIVVQAPAPAPVIVQLPPAQTVVENPQVVVQSSPPPVAVAPPSVRDMPAPAAPVATHVVAAASTAAPVPSAGDTPPAGVAPSNAAVDAAEQPVPGKSGRVAVVIGALALLAWLLASLRNRALAAQAASLTQSQRELRSRHLKLKQESEQLRQLATNDPLTGTLNRQAFGTELRERIGQLAPFRRPLSLLVFDLDHFKQINDRDGHLAGDAALRLVAGVVRECLDSDDLFGRFGGDEFLIAMTDQSAGDVAAVAERIRGLVEVRALGHQPPLTGLSLSMGIAHAIAPGDYEIDTLFQRADSALYLAKRRGRNRVVVADMQLLETAGVPESTGTVRHL